MDLVNDLLSALTISVDVTEMRAMPPDDDKESHIGYAMYKGRCDLVDHWLDNQYAKDSQLWFSEFVKYYSPALLAVLPRLLETHEIELDSVVALVAIPEARESLVPYLHRFPVERLVSCSDVSQNVFLEKLFDLGAPQILAYVAQHSKNNQQDAMRYLFDRCTDINYQLDEYPYTTTVELLCVLGCGYLFPEAIADIERHVPEELHPILCPMRGDGSRDAPVQITTKKTTRLLRCLLEYRGSPIAMLLVEVFVSIAGSIWKDPFLPPESVKWLSEPDSEGDYPLIWLLFRRPAYDATKRILTATRNQRVIALALSRRMNPHIFLLLTRGLERI